MFGEDDRSLLNAVHGVSSNLKVASSSGELWHKRPTPIDIPSNSSARRERAGHGFTMSDLGRNQQQITNMTANQTLLKKRKIDQEHYFLGRGTSMNKTSTSKRKSASRETDCIVLLDTDDERPARSTKQPDHDATTFPPLMELDPMDIPSAYKNQDRDIEVSPSDLPATTSYLSKRKSGPPRFRPYEVGFDEREYAASSSPASGSRQVKDGDATRALELQVGLSSDPISDSSPPPEGRVKGMIRQIENNQQKSRYLDLREMQSRSHGIKGSMKTKNSTRQKATGFPVDETMTPTLFKHSSSHAERLWIERWICGAQLRENPKNCFVTWEQRTLTIWEDDRKILWFKLIEELSCIEYCEGEPFTFKLKSKVPPRSTFDPRNKHSFKMGDSHMSGECVVWAEKREDVEKTYTSFISWFKKHKQKSMVLRTTAGQSMWDTASRGAELAAGALGRQSEAKRTDKHPLECSVSLEDNYDSEPPPVDELPQDPESHMKTSVLPLRPASRTMTTQISTEGLRRSTRRRRSPSVDPEEVILCYPQGIPGAVYIKHSDYRRLRPGEFLNDTLIEFGLKLWLCRLQESNPELASQVHVFSSFFYHLLDNKDPDEGYESVRKWTAKFNIFSKKYIIVPINDDSEQHWYLAIIYHPEHILTPTSVIKEKSPTAEGVLKSVFASRPSPSPSTTDLSVLTSGWQTGDLASKPPSTVISTESSASADDIDIARMNEAEEERSVTEGLLVCDSSCSFEVETVDSEASSDAISNRENDASEIGMTNVAVTSSGMTPTKRADMELEDRDFSPMVLDHTEAAAVIHDMDMHDVSSVMQTNGETTFHTDNDVEQVSASIAPANFYGMSERAMGKQKAIPNQAVTRRDVQPVPVINRSAEPKDDQYENGSLMPMPENENMTYIFTFDSLGTERLPAIERLAKYLKQEAQDKLKRLDTGDAVGFKAQVPVQPNFYDCGLYLLHFAETFMSDPVKYAQIIRSRGKGPIESRTRKGDWKYKQAVDMRDRFRAEIEKLSAEWKKDRAEKEEAKRREAAEEGPSIKVLESSDDEINIVETTPIPASNRTKKRGKRKTLNKDTDVMRLR